MKPSNDPMRSDATDGDAEDGCGYDVGHRGSLTRAFQVDELPRLVNRRFRRRSR